MLGEEYARLQEAASAGAPSLFTYCGATNPAEFFAVASEVFFEQASLMAESHSELYRELSWFYQVDPLSW